MGAECGIAMAKSRATSTVVSSRKVQPPKRRAVAHEPLARLIELRGRSSRVAASPPIQLRTPCPFELARRGLSVLRKLGVRVLYDGVTDVTAQCIQMFEDLLRGSDMLVSSVASFLSGREPWLSRLSVVPTREDDQADARVVARALCPRTGMLAVARGQVRLE